MTVSKYLICLLLQRLVLPVLLAACFLLRPVAISIPYFLLFFYLPLVPVATRRSMRGRTGIFLKLLLASTVLLCALQIAFQITVASLDRNFLPNCKFLQIILRDVGLVNLKRLPVIDIVYWLAPEILMFVTSLVLYFTLAIVSTPRIHDIENEGETLMHFPTKRASWTIEIHVFFMKLGVFLSLFSILVAASLRPSVAGGVYYLVYLGAGTFWACHRPLRKRFGYIIRILMVFIIIHMGFILSYQTQTIQAMFDSNSTIPRYFELNDILQPKCGNGTDNRKIQFNKILNTDSYLSPVAILICYYILAFTSSLLFSKPPEENKIPERTKLAANKWHMPVNKLKLANKITRRRRDSNAEETAPGDIQMAPLELKDKDVPSTERNKKINFVDQMIFGIETIASIIYKNSYIFTNICMMAWSIMYHSWFAFIFLIWANVIWVIPNQRNAMLQSSPFIVLYALFLLLAQYAYSMNLYEDELPTKMKSGDINLIQIGFERYDHYPVEHILIKCAFTVMFWITLRQFIQENKLKKQSSAIADTDGAAAGMTRAKREKSEFMKRMGDLFKSLLLKSWIWIIMLTVFTSGIVGTQMTVFRIIYMALFLVFLIMFQISWRAWKAFMYGFWLILIVYAKLILILVYTYQFDRFPEYWANYLGVPYRFQKEIGLDVFETKELFLHLLTPTLVVIMTVIQLNYFHYKYIDMLQLPKRNSSIVSTGTDNNSIRFGQMPDTEDNTSEYSRDAYGNPKKHYSIINALKFKRMTLAELKERLNEFVNFVIEFIETIWLFLEIHLIKLILFVAFLLGIFEVSLLHICFVVLSVIGLSIHTKLQIVVSRVISLLVAILIITKMIYQVDYLNHHDYDVVCNNVTNPNKVNNADWFGLHEAKPGLMKLLRGYIYYLLIVTLHGVVRFRQHNRRGHYNQPYVTPAVIFPNVNRINSENDLPHMIKFLMNYGFYKFGVEFCLIALVALIAARLDIIACIYSIWLIVIFSVNRQNVSQIWLIFKLFIIIFIIIQYILIVGLPPGICIIYPWNTVVLSQLQKWAMLPDDLLYKQVEKLIFDFILLLVVTRQAVVFRIERRYTAKNHAFPGGNNRDITAEISKQGASVIENITPDYTSRIRNWLDIMKRAVFFGFFWFSLAIVFLTGAERVNLFSIGYLISSFIFLWQGTDFYLRPINTIIRWWRAMIAYNLFVITFKTYLQIAGCLLFDEIACWVIQLLGITCIINFDARVINANCLIHDENVGLLWDCVCFACLLLQLRIFKSYYFCHIVNDTKASNILASRGAQLIEEFEAKQFSVQVEHENDILEKIKAKMDRIKASQQKLKGLREPTIHAQAIRSGDYYMFEELDDKIDLGILDEKSDDDLIDEESAGWLKTKLTLGKLITLKIQEKNEMDRKHADLKRHSSYQPTLTLEKSFDTRTSISEPILRDTQPSSPSPERAKPSVTDDQQPSTSRGLPISPEKKQKHSKSTIGSLEDAPIDKEGKSLAGLLLIGTFIESIIVTLTVKLNRVSRNYRYILKILSKEKKILKSTEGFGVGLRISTAVIFGQAPSRSEQRKVTLLEKEHEDRMGGASEDFLKKEHSVIVELIAAIWFAILSHTDYLCYFMVLLNQVQSASILSLPLPLMILFWGTLTVPRPSKTFWITIIAYTQTVVLLKCASQFEMLWWNKIKIPENQPLAPARIFGIEKKKSYANYDLALLLVVFFHRFMLKCVGLWKTELRDEVLQDGIYNVINKIDRDDDEEDDNGLVVELDNNNSEDIIRTLVTKGMTVQRAITNNTEFQRIIRKERHEITLQELIFVLNLELQGVVVSGSFTQILVNGTVVNIVKSNNQEIHLAKVNSREDVNFVNEKGDGDKVEVSNLIEETSNYFPGIVKLASKKYASSIGHFFETLLGPASRATRDVYVYLILCDFINFLVLVFGFTSFGSSQGDEGVIGYLKENQIPIAFLVMLIIQFILIIIDRALYLRKYLLGKIIFQYILIATIHVWMFFVLPAVTGRSFNMKLAPVIWYLIKCVYLLFSAYQIRCGYPKRILGNFLTKAYGIINMISHKVFLLIPFLFELRTLMDWIWTDTTMTLFDWLKMEDIFVSVYTLKCTRRMETDFPKPRGLKTALLIKYMMGGGFLFVLVVIIWFPIAFFAFGNTVGEANPPYEVTVKLRIGPYEPVYTMTAQEHNIMQFTESGFHQLTKHFSRDGVALTFLSTYEPEDLTAIILSANSTSLWNISPPDVERLRDDVVANKTLTVRFEYSVYRNMHSQKDQPDLVSDQHTYELEIGDSRRKILKDILDGNNKNKALIIPNLFPKFLKVKNQGVLMPTARLLGPDNYENDDNAFGSLTLSLFYTGKLNFENKIWWEVKESCNDSIQLSLPYDDCAESTVIYLFNDKIFPSQLSILAASGIIGLYVSLVIVIARVVRSFFSLMYIKIMFEELPYVDRVLQLCLDIYLVREALEFELEEDLFAKLIFLYRSPETMIKWTRPKEEEGGRDDGNDGPSNRTPIKKSRHSPIA